MVPTLVDLFSILLQRKNNTAGRWCMGKHFQKSAEKTQKAFSSSKPYIRQVFFSWIGHRFTDQDVKFDSCHSKSVSDEIKLADH